MNGFQKSGLALCGLLAFTFSVSAATPPVTSLQQLTFFSESYPPANYLETCFFPRLVPNIGNIFSSGPVPLPALKRW